MSNQRFNGHRAAALALLNQFVDISHREAGFLGHVAVAAAITERQRKWLVQILERRELPSLLDGGGQ